jgi:uncharacterized protein
LQRREAPARTCVACRESHDKRELLRVVRAPDGTVAFDPTRKANGRGAYVCRDATCIETAIAKGGLARALGTSMPVDVADELRRIVSRGTSDGTQ